MGNTGLEGDKDWLHLGFTPDLSPNLSHEARAAIPKAVVCANTGAVGNYLAWYLLRVSQLAVTDFNVRLRKVPCEKCAKPDKYHTP